MSNKPFETPQAYYDGLVERARDGRFPSLNEAGYCVYRTVADNGDVRKCAAGILVPDSCKEKFEEHCGLEGKTNEGIIRLHLPDGLSVEDVSQCQSIHDSVARAEWDAEAFILRLNDLTCFKNVTRVTPYIRGKMVQP